VAEIPALTASAASASVNEDGTVALNITATPAESADQDAATSVLVSGLGGAKLSTGQDLGNGQFLLQLADLPGLTLHAADDDATSLTSA